MLSTQLSDTGPSLADAQLASGGGATVELAGNADWKDAAELIAGAVQVDIRFDSFKDGRGFTLATQLRERVNYKGRLRAVGDLIPDQAQFLKRVGFDAVSPDRKDLAADWARAESRYSVLYQPAIDGAETVLQQRVSVGADLVLLNARYREREAMDVLRDALTHTWRGRVALLSSFGAEAAILLHMIAQIDPATPVLFLDTGRLFAQTEQYQKALSEQLGLTNVQVLGPDADEVAREDADDKLWTRNPDACCALRKVRPLNKALGNFDALITGRKRFHGGERLSLPVVERIDGRIRLNPLASWTGAEINAYFERHDLPQHPLTDMGYTSIGCWTCTAPAQSAENVRSGRWANQEKTECGIHSALGVAAE